MKPADLQEWAAFNDDFLKAASEAKAAGRTAAEFASAWTVPAKYSGYTADAKRVQANVELIYKELR
jgi:hypothetical protein